MDGGVQVPEGWINIDLSHPVRLETYDGTCKVIIYHTSTVTKKVLVPKASENSKHPQNVVICDTAGGR